MVDKGRTVSTIPPVATTGWTRDWDEADDEMLMMMRQANVSTAQMANWFGVSEQEIENRIDVVLFLVHLYRPN
jgi:hypothetical protein